MLMTRPLAVLLVLALALAMLAACGGDDDSERRHCNFIDDDYHILVNDGSDDLHRHRQHHRDA